MREILFRGKRKDNGEWIYGSLLSFHGHEIFDISAFNNYFPVSYETIGQWTGLVDKNGNQVFEGDIVKTKYGRLCSVVWFSSQSYTGWDLAAITTGTNCVHTRCPDSFDIYKSDNLEVVGNIHDNPELLEESK